MNKDHEVEVVCAEDWDSGEAYWNGVTEDTHKGVRVHRIHLNWTKANNPNQVLYDSLPVEKWFGSFLDLTRPDIVHVTSAHTLGVGVLRAARRAGIPLVLTLMDFWFLCPRTILLRGDGKLCDGLTMAWECQHCLLTSSNLYRRMQVILSPKYQRALWAGISQKPILARQRGALGWALDVADRKSTMKQAMELPDVILSHSRFVQHVFARVGLSHRTIHLPNGHDMSWASHYRGKQHSSVIRFGYMGQIVELKGVHILVEAFQNAGLDGHARLHIWGNLEADHSYTQGLRALAGNSGAIRLHGWFERDQLAHVLATTDVLVVPSLWYENAPLVIQEAFATETPVIATNLGGMAEAVRDEVSGLLFERGEVEDLTRQLRRIVEEPGLLDTLRAGIPPVKTVEEEVVELEAVYSGLISHK